MRLVSLFLSLTFLATSVNAKTVWSDFSVSYLRGSDYEVGDNKRQVVTFEHAAGTSWGDSFLFVDRLQSNNGDNETYGEWSPRLKLSNVKFGVFESIYLAGTAEFGAFDGASGFSNSFTHYLVGVGTDLKLPGFSFFKWNIYQRNNENKDDGLQTTVSWGVPLGPLYYDGFMDLVASTDDSETSMNLTSQLKYDIAPLLGIDSKFYVGIEYVFWQNKFGIDGVDERNVNLLVKFHF